MSKKSTSKSNGKAVAKNPKPVRNETLRNTRPYRDFHLPVRLNEVNVETKNGAHAAGAVIRYYKSLLHLR